MGNTVLIVTDSLPPVHGGAGCSSARIAHIIWELGYRCIVAVFPEHNDRAASPSVRPSVRNTLRRHGQVSWFCAPEYWTDHVRSAWIEQSIRRMLTDEGVCALLVIYIGRLAAPAVFAATRAGVPLIASLRGSDLYRDTLVPGGFDRLRMSIEYSSTVVTVNEESAHIVTRLFPSCRQRVHVIRNSVSQYAMSCWLRYRTRLAPAFAQHPLRFSIGLVGADRAHKGADTALGAFARLRATVPCATLTVIGTSSEEHEYLTTVRRSLDLDRHVHILPRLSHRHIWRCIGAFDAMLLPSWYEGSPNVLLEAILFRRPLVASRIAAVTEVLEHGHSVRMASPCDEFAFCEELLWLYGHPQEAVAQTRCAATVLNTIYDGVNEKRAWSKAVNAAITGVHTTGTGASCS